MTLRRKQAYNKKRFRSARSEPDRKEAAARGTMDLFYMKLFPLPARVQAFYDAHLYRPLARAHACLQGIRASHLKSAALCFGLLLFVPCFVPIQPVTYVTLNGQPVGAVADEATIWAVQAGITSDLALSTGSAPTALPGLSYESRWAIAPETLDAGALRQAMLDASGSLRELAAILVDGKPVTYCNSVQDAQSAIDAVRLSYESGMQDAETVFLEPVEVRMVAAPAGHATQCGMAAGELTGAVDVKVNATVSYTEAIPYETVTRENVSMPSDQTTVVQEGQTGQAEVSAQVVAVNGEVRERTIVSRAVLAEPRKQIVEVGAERPASVGTGRLIAPLADYTFTSGYRTSHRAAHAGVDLATPTGSAVLAADGGRVTTAQWSDSYGNFVVIDHGNGLSTVYAHNSSLVVSAGDTVAQGELIALSGNTGNSTGPHVHFEVRVNGVAVDPTLYVALA